MQISLLLDLVKESGLSPEKFGELTGVSGMTIRRWAERSRNWVIPKLYVPAIRETCYQLLAEGRLRVDSPLVRRVLLSSNSAQHGAALKNLGLTSGNFTLAGEDDGERLLEGLGLIGAQADKREMVDSSNKKILSFKNLGAEWSRRVGFLLQVIRSNRFSGKEKLIGYGALFYLITPIDFIPDHIPLIGLMDDFGILGLAVAHYASKFPRAV